ncbi:hypothetical protein [Halorussus lipolyticus]|uniref:hypothetical protein n=1 Tax=Halorussus lipolyticus TaxID=3034024 RepID=UPI0023E838F3|nr:hypothetical protein [Halorussus sp. DT80]
MNPISLLPKSGTNFKLYYLVPISFVYMFSQFGNQTYLLLSLVALIGAASRHVEGEAIYGPGGEEIAELSREEKIRRIGTLLFRDKKPYGYSATSWSEIIEEARLNSKLWGVLVIILALFQGTLSILYLFAVYEFYLHRFEIDFIGGVLLFSLIALVVYGGLKNIWPNASHMDEDIPEIDPELQDIVEKFMYMLYAEGITTTGVSYEPAEGGLFEIACEVDYEYGETMKEDINQIAILFCSIIDRSPYPISRADFTVETSDDIVIDFYIEPEWCRGVLSGGLSSDEYLQNVNQTVSIKAPDRKTIESVF